VDINITGCTTFFDHINYALSFFTVFLLIIYSTYLLK
jgi:hypothetical protein